MKKFELPSKHFAALRWRPFPEELPDIDETVLVCNSSLVTDIAVYRGLDDEGQHRFILTDIELCSKQIIGFARIQRPKRIKEE